jgi:uncharacterized protein
VTPVGTLAEIHRFPVKSMAGERRRATEIDWQGLEGDRQYGFVRAGNATRFPWFTGRDWSDLVRHRAALDAPEDARRSGVTVTAPDGAAFALADPALAARLEAGGGQPVALLQLGIGAYDLMPVSIVSTASFAAIDRAHGSPLDPRRFRANLVVEAEVPEGEWPGRRVRLGAGEDAAELLLAYPAPRCAMVTICPDTGARDPRVLRTVVEHFGGGFTWYASVAKPGVVREGDPVAVG